MLLLLSVLVPAPVLQDLALLHHNPPPPLDYCVSPLNVQGTQLVHLFEQWFALFVPDVLHVGTTSCEGASVSREETP